MQKRFLISFCRLVTETFFRRVEVTGTETVPADGPVIFAGNHPNALMDGWLMSANSSRWPLYFLASAKLWEYPILRTALNATGAVPVYRREDHAGGVDNEKAFARLYELLECGECVCIFPEGTSHNESQLVQLKTGTARIALNVAKRGKVSVSIIPCGLNYINRHRFRSQALLNFGKPILVDEAQLEHFCRDEQAAVVALTERIANDIRGLTINAPDWRTVRAMQIVRRLYKPGSARLTTAQYVELTRRFVDGYLQQRDDPALQALMADVEDYQARLDMLGLKDHQLRQPVNIAKATRKLTVRSLAMFLLLPLAIPGALLHLPIGWIAATAGDKLSYEMDDVATLKVFAVILLLPALYVAVAVFTAVQFGLWWGLAALIALPFSFFASVRLIEAEVGLILSILSLLRLGRFRGDVEDLRNTRTRLVERIRARVEQSVDPQMQRIFTEKDFAIGKGDSAVRD